MRSKLRGLFVRVNNLNPTRAILLSFLLIILFGALLLCLPISTRDGKPAEFINALFTATSATCVTGLVVKDTYTYWSTFGQVVILLMIQIGGLGLMSTATIFSFLLRRKIGLQERLIMMQSLNLDDISGVVRLMRHMLIWTFLAEGVGAIILSMRFIMDFGIAKGIYKGIFHSVSAFCNAGFDLMGDQKPFINLMNYSGDFFVNMTIMSLIIIGGLGFFVWEDIYQKHDNRHWFRSLHLHSKLVLIITAILVFGGAIFFYISEYSNPETMKFMSQGERVLSSFFQSVTPRTAGYNTIDQAGMTGPSKLVTMLLMFVGGSPGSTAGGIKTVTAGLMILNMIAVFQGRRNIHVFGRSIPRSKVIYSAAITMSGILFVFLMSVIMSFIEDAPYLDIVYECISAFGTVGLSVGLTPHLQDFSKIILALLMYLGRVGVLTISVAFLLNQHHKPKIKYPECKVLIG